MTTVASTHSPQFTHRQAGADGCSLISSNRESVKLATINPRQRAQVDLVLVRLLKLSGFIWWPFESVSLFG